MTTVTHWWWIRHAPVATDDPARIWGQMDVPCDPLDAAAVAARAETLPEDAVWATSHLGRTKETALALRGTDAALSEPDLAEQDLGSWQGMTWDEVYRDYGAENADFWKDPGRHCPPGGESFADVMDRVGAAMTRLTAAHAGRNIVAVSHGGAIRAALGVALGMEPRRALAIQVDTLSLTRMDHIDGPARHQLRGVWRIVGVNLPPGATV